MLRRNRELELASKTNVQMVTDSGLLGKRIILSANTSGEATCDESFVERNNSHHEKSNHTWFGALNCCVNVDLLFQHTRDHHDNHASNHGDYPATTADRSDNHHNDAPHGRRLLISTHQQFQRISDCSVVELSPLGTDSAHGKFAAFQSIAMRMRARPLG